MITNLIPSFIAKDIYSVSCDFLTKQNIKGIILDIDNTLVTYSTEEPPQKVIDWIIELKNEGFVFCIVSNAKMERVRRFNQKLGLYSVYSARKPTAFGFKRAAEKMGIANENIAVIGDQVFTDIWGGNKEGMVSILVDPIERKESFLIELKRLLERPILYLGRKNIKNIL